MVLRFVLWLFSVAFAFLVVTNVWIMWETADAIHTELSDVEPAAVALVLGTSKSKTGGGPNVFFTTRMQAAADLYHAGKVKHLILSGDNETRYYNEPADMLNALLKLGVPRSDMTLDYAGFRTLDSVVRSKEVFGQKKIVIVTQQFHAYRALFISDFYDIEAVSFAAADAEGMSSVLSREWLARPKAVLDLYLLNETPRFLGEKEVIDIKK